jgi:hypothetical protein
LVNIWLLGECTSLLFNEEVDLAVLILLLFTTFEAVLWLFGKYSALLSNVVLVEIEFE